MIIAWSVHDRIEVWIATTALLTLPRFVFLATTSAPTLGFETGIDLFVVVVILVLAVVIAPRSLVTLLGVARTSTHSASHASLLGLAPQLL